MYHHLPIKQLSKLISQMPLIRKRKRNKHLKESSLLLLKLLLKMSLLKCLMELQLKTKEDQLIIVQTTTLMSFSQLWMNYLIINYIKEAIALPDLNLSQNINPRCQRRRLTMQLLHLPCLRIIKLHKIKSTLIKQA